MTIVLFVVGGASLIWCVMGVGSSVRTIGRWSAPARRVLHAVSGLTSAIAAAILLLAWSWAGLGVAIAFSIAAFLLEAIAGRFWAARLLASDPAAADVFLRDP